MYQFLYLFSSFSFCLGSDFSLFCDFCSSSSMLHLLKDLFHFLNLTRAINSLIRAQINFPVAWSRARHVNPSLCLIKSVKAACVQPLIRSSRIRLGPNAVHRHVMAWLQVKGLWRAFPHMYCLFTISTLMKCHTLDVVTLQTCGNNCWLF